MGFSYCMNATLGVVLECDDIRDDSREFKEFVQVPDEDDDEWVLRIGRYELKDNGEKYPHKYFLGLHWEGSDWRYNPEDLFFTPEELDNPFLYQSLKELLEPLNLWNPENYGLHIWVDVA